MGFRTRARTRRAARALERQLDYQRRKAAAVAGREQAVIASMMTHSAAVRARIEAVRPIAPDARVLEVGCGAHGLIFCFGTSEGVGVDPLADHYAALFPAWQSRARTVAAYGEALPFGDAEFDLVLCDNVVDHAEGPGRIVAEMARVLRPGGLLYFTVNVHHSVYHAAASLHAGWRALGLPFEITPFADHTVHLTPAAARRLFEGLPLRRLSEKESIAEAKRAARLRPPRHPGDRFKRLFYKNALYETIAMRE
jgi:SAM-dependent methyltransferase